MYTSSILTLLPLLSLSPQHLRPPSTRAHNTLPNHRRLSKPQAIIQLVSSNIRRQNPQRHRPRRKPRKLRHRMHRRGGRTRERSH